MAYDVVHFADLDETREEILFLAYGAPTRHGNAEYLEDVPEI